MEEEIKVGKPFKRVKNVACVIKRKGRDDYFIDCPFEDIPKEVVEQALHEISISVRAESAIDTVGDEIATKLVQLSEQRKYLIMLVIALLITNIVAFVSYMNIVGW